MDIELSRDPRSIDDFPVRIICDEPACATRTRQMNVYGKRCLISGCRGQMTQEYNNKMLYNQLLYYDGLFDIEKTKSKATDDDRGNHSGHLY